jgi:glyoxylase-like metal-dependent hydrolase (beta-lactamase superfamily II)
LTQIKLLQSQIHIQILKYDVSLLYLGQAQRNEVTMKPSVHAFFDEATNTLTYLVREAEGRACAIIDSVLDFDYASGRTDTRSADAVVGFVRAHKLDLKWILETHVHADHLSAAPYIQERLGGKIGIGQRITVVQDTFGKVFNEGTRFARDGSQFDQLFEDGDSLMIGQMRADVMHTPGHTPACLTYVIGDAAFVGDTLFMPDFGTARCDFPGGSSETLFDSVQRILSLPDDTRIFVGHDYKAPGREDYAWETTVGAQKALNIHIGAGKSKADFVAMRDARDATLDMPRLIIPSLQINMRAGQMPEAEDNGVSYLKVPMNGI